MKRLPFALRDERQSGQLAPPLVRDLDCVTAVTVLLHGHALGVCVLNELLHVSRLQGIEHIPKVFPRRQSPLRRWIRHVLHEVRIWLHKLPKFLHGELVEVRHADMYDFTELEQLLFFCEQLLHEILVHHLLWRHVELKLVPHVREEVLLGPEP